MHLNYGVISGSHACRDYVILDAGLHTTCPGERVLVTTRFNVTFLALRLCYDKYTYLFLKGCRKSNNIWLLVFWCSHIVCIRHYSL